MKNSSVITFILSFALLNILSINSAWAIGEHCLIQPNQIANVAQKVFKTNKDAGEYFPEQSIIQNKATSNVKFKNGALKTSSVITFEGYYRPSQTAWFSILPIPLFVAQLDRNRNIVYICAHNEENVENNYVIIYFLKGYKISKSTFSTFIGNALFRSIEIDSINLVPFGTSAFNNLFDKGDGVNPFAAFAAPPLAVFGFIQNLAANVLNEFTGLGVERIVVRDDHLLLESKIDLDNPDKPRFSRKISLTGLVE